MLLELGFPRRIVVYDDTPGLWIGLDAANARDRRERLAIDLEDFGFRPPVRHLHADPPTDFVLNTRVMFAVGVRPRRRVANGSLRIRSVSARYVSLADRHGLPP